VFVTSASGTLSGTSFIGRAHQPRGAGNTLAAVSAAGGFVGGGGVRAAKWADGRDQGPEGVV